MTTYVDILILDGSFDWAVSVYWGEDPNPEWDEGYFRTFDRKSEAKSYALDLKQWFLNSTEGHVKMTFTEEFKNGSQRSSNHESTN